MKKLLLLFIILTLIGCQNSYPEFDEDDFPFEEFEEDSNIEEESEEEPECEIPAECIEEPVLTDMVDTDRPIKSTQELVTIYRETSCESEQQVVTDANTTQTYTYENFGFQLDIPYNPKWGTLDYKVAVAEQAELKDHEQAIGKIIWGAFVSDPHIGCTRAYTVLITKPRTVKQALAEYWQDEEVYEDHSWGFEIEPTSYTANGIQIAEYIANGSFCPQGAVEVFTPNFNLYFTSICHDKKLNDQFKEIAKSLNFL